MTAPAPDPARFTARPIEAAQPLLSEALRRRWYVVVTALLLGGLAGYAIASTAAPVYEATATLLLRDPSDADAGIFLRTDDAVRLTELHARRAETIEVHRRAGAATGLVQDEVADAVTVLADPALLGLRIVARSDQPAAAAALADATAAAYEEVEAERQAVARPADAAAGRPPAEGTVELREPAEVPATPTRPRPVRDAGLAGAAAALVATAVLWLGATRVPTARTALGPGAVLEAPLLAALPVSRRRRARRRAASDDQDGPARLVADAIGQRLSGRPGIVLLLTAGRVPARRGADLTHLAERTVAALRETGGSVVLVLDSAPRPIAALQQLRADGALVVVEGARLRGPGLVNLALVSDVMVAVTRDRTATRDLRRLRQLSELAGGTLLGYLHTGRSG